jgi:hypothetical protein
MLLPCKAAQYPGGGLYPSVSLIEIHLGAIMTFKGTVSDFDGAGFFGLIIADDGGVLPFNLRETPPALRSRFGIGTRTRFSKQASEPAMRAVDVAPIDDSNDGKSSSPSATKA